MEQNNKNTTTELYKKLFYRIGMLLIFPKIEWKKIKQENKSLNYILSEFALPMLAFCTISAFLGRILGHQVFSLEASLKFAIIIFISLFATIYLAFAILKVVLVKWKLNKDNLMALVIYSSVLWYAVTFITLLIPELFVLNIIVLYSVFIIYRGVNVYIDNIKKNKRILLSIFIFAVIHLIPLIIKYSLLKFVTL